MFAWELYLLQRVRPWDEGCEPPMLCLLMIRRDSMQHLSQALNALLVKKAKCQGRKDLEWRTLVLVGNESALLHRVRQVKIVLLGQFTFRADCVWESLWQSRLDCKVGYRGCSQLMGFVPFSENIHDPQEMEESLLVGSVAQQTFSPHRHTGDTQTVAPFCSPSVRGKHHRLKHSSSTTAVVRGVCVASADPSATFLVSLKCTVCSLALCFPELRG